MPRKQDVFSSFEDVIAQWPPTSPWTASEEDLPFFAPDYDLLAKVMGIPVGAKSSSASGRLPKSVDAWAASELRRAGFDPDAVWPRLHQPRVVTNELRQYIRALPKDAQTEAWNRLAKNSKAAPSSSDVLGRAYFKQVDVLVSHWSTGPEILISTKCMVSSFANNRKNRFEEAYGDAKNLRGRFPLASMGFLFVVRSTIPASGLELTIDMMRKLRAEEDVYEATALVLADWRDGDPDSVRIRNDMVPSDLQSGPFFNWIIDAVLSRTPISMHPQVRQSRSKSDLNIDP